MNQLHNKTIHWAEEKGILQHSNPKRQLLKTHEEIGELLKAIQDNNLDEIKDAIGDILVTLIIYNRLAGLKYEFGKLTDKPLKFADNVNELLHAFSGLYTVGVSKYNLCYLNRINTALTNIAEKHELTLHDCLNSAYNVIKNRTGKMINGTFVKD